MHSQDSKRTDPFEGYCAFVLLRKISKTGSGCTKQCPEQISKIYLMQVFTSVT